MREHFRFLSKNRKVLRLKLNAAEDLLLNGAREPTHRGVCQHLLAKVDRSAINSALERIDVPAERTRLLEGLARFSSDVAVVLLYLESLSESTAQPQAAAALLAGLERLDFAEVSAAQMRRLLALIEQLFDANERPQLLFGLLGSASFRKAFDSSLERLPDSLSAVFTPLRAAHAKLVDGKRRVADPKDLDKGIDLLVQASDAVLRSHPEQVRRRLCELGLERPNTPQRSIAALLASFPKESRVYSELAMRQAGALLARHRDDQARKLLNDVATHHREFKLPGRWLAALDKPRLGRIALDDDGDGGAERKGFWLDRQRPVWIRAGGPSDADAFAREAELRRTLVFPSVAPLLVSGTHEGSPYLATPLFGHPVRRGTKQLSQAVALAFDGVSLLSGLADIGVRLPDVERRRFSLDHGGRLWLVNLQGATRAPIDEVRHAHASLARLWCQTSFESIVALPSELACCYEDTANLVELSRALSQWV